ncbi:MAG: FG-GAP-like repeat-containing protein [Candidatus Njordarchaeales archaeon]
MKKALLLYLLLFSFLFLSLTYSKGVTAQNDGRYRENVEISVLWVMNSTIPYVSPLTTLISITDLNHDGINEVILEGYGVVVLDGISGKILWSKCLEYPQNPPPNVYPVFIDVNRDGVKDVILASGIGLSTSNTTLLALNGLNGEIIWRRDLPKAGIINMLAAVDINDDGFTEIIVGNGYGYIALLDYSGQIMWERVIEFPELFHSWFSIYDFDNDGRLDIVLLTTSKLSVVVLTYRGELVFYRRAPSLGEEWGGSSGEFSLIADIDRDGYPDAIFATPRVLVWKIMSNKLIRTPIFFEHIIFFIALYDITHDSYPEIIAFGSNFSESIVVAYDVINGKVIWRTTLPPFGDEAYVRGFVLGDVDGDNRLEALFTSGSLLFALNIEDGSLSWYYKFPDEISLGQGPMIGDVDGDGFNEVVVVGENLTESLKMKKYYALIYCLKPNPSGHRIYWIPGGNVSRTNSLQLVDSDFDFLSDYSEHFYGTDPYKPDSDGDSYLDGTEVDLGTDPLNKWNYPRAIIHRILIGAIVVMVIITGYLIRSKTRRRHHDATKQNKKKI